MSLTENLMFSSTGPFLSLSGMSKSTPEIRIVPIVGMSWRSDAMSRSFAGLPSRSRRPLNVPVKEKPVKAMRSIFALPWSVAISKRSMRISAGLPPPPE